MQMCQKTKFSGHHHHQPVPHSIPSRGEFDNFRACAEQFPPREPQHGCVSVMTTLFSSLVKSQANLTISVCWLCHQPSTSKETVLGRQLNEMQRGKCQILNEFTGSQNLSTSNAVSRVNTGLIERLRNQLHHSRQPLHMLFWAQFNPFNNSWVKL